MLLPRGYCSEHEVTHPNDIQIGGDHYKGADFQPWDWAKNSNGALGYYECTSIKYITRFRKKGGVEDLNKVLHYLDKMLFESKHGEIAPNYDQRRSLRTVMKYNRLNDCDGLQSNAITMIVMWQCPEDLEEAKKLVEQLIRVEKHEARVNYEWTNGHPPPMIDVKEDETPIADVVGSGAPYTVRPAADGHIMYKEPPAKLAEDTPLPAYVPLKPFKPNRAWDIEPKGVVNPEDNVE